MTGAGAGCGAEPGIRGPCPVEVRVDILAFRGWRPASGCAERVACVPYDTVDADEARELAAGKPDSFLRVVKAELEFPPETDPYSAQVYERAAANLARLRREGILQRDAAPGLYVYRQTMGRHVQNGVVACCRAADYEAGRIRKHEHTREAKLRDRIRLIETLGAQTGPVFLAYRDRAAIDALVAAAETRAPDADVSGPAGTRHEVWRVDEPGPLCEAFRAVDRLYIADGHHRAAAAAEVAARRGAGGESDRFLAVLFPAGQLQILPYNRLVKGEVPGGGEAWLARLRAAAVVAPAADGVPSGPGHVRLYLAGRWWDVAWKGTAPPDPVNALDVSRLQHEVLAPLLGIVDPRTDERLEFVGGIRGLPPLVEAVDRGRAAMAFSMAPVEMRAVMDIADAGMIMPPKSTWFEP